MASFIQYIWEGKWIDAAVRPYLAAWGDLFYALIYLVTIVLPYIKTRDLAVSGILGIIYGIAMLSVLPLEAQQLAYFVIVASTGLVFYKLVTRKETE